MIDFDSPVLNNQYATLGQPCRISQGDCRKPHICVRAEVEPLVKNNLIKGGDLDNAIVIYDSPMEQTELDRLADLMGVPLQECQ